MITQDNILAMFPLGVCILPGEKLKLHIFEARYKQLINDCQSDGICFGIPYVHEKHIGPFGTTVKLSKVIETYENGELDIEVEGVDTFRISEYFDVMPVKLYGGAYISMVHDENVSEEGQTLRAQLIDLICKLKKVKNTFQNLEDWTSYNIAKAMNLSKEQKYVLISQPTEIGRLKYLKNLLSFQLKLIEIEEELGERHKFN